MSRRNSYDTVVSFHPFRKTLIVDKFNNGGTTREYILSKATLDLFNMLTNELTSNTKNNVRYFSTLFKPIVETHSNHEIVITTLLEMLSRALSNPDVKPEQYDKIAYRKLTELTPIEKMQLKTILAQSDIKTWKLVSEAQTSSITLDNKITQRKNGMRV